MTTPQITSNEAVGFILNFEIPHALGYWMFMVVDIDGEFTAAVSCEASADHLPVPVGRTRITFTTDEPAGRIEISGRRTKFANKIVAETNRSLQKYFLFATN